MKSLRLRCDEVDHLPASMELPVAKEELVSLWWLPTAAESRLRRVIATAGGPPQDDATPMLTLRVQGVRDGALACVSFDESFEVLVEEGSRAERVLSDDELRSGVNLRVTAPGGQSTRISLTVLAGAAQGLNAAVGGSDHRRTNAAALAASPEAWRLPTPSEAAEAPLDALKGVWKRLEDLYAAHRTTILMFAPYVLFMGTGAVLYTLSTDELTSVTAERDALATELTRAQQALTALTAADADCHAERDVLAATLNDTRARFESAASLTLNLTRARRDAFLIGGANLTEPGLDRIDADRGQALITAVVSSMMTQTPDPAALATCLAATPTLDGRLSDYTLLTAASPGIPCPDAHEQLIDGVLVRGRLSLAPHATSRYGPSAEGRGADPTQDLDWSAFTLLNGVSRVKRALLLADVSGRPPVAPAEAEAWSLGLWVALNLSPTTAGADNIGPVEDCVPSLLTQLAQAQRAPLAGEPILPSLAETAKTPPRGVITSPACPWTAAGISRAAQITLDAAALRARLTADAPAARATLSP